MSWTMTPMRKRKSIQNKRAADLSAAHFLIYHADQASVFDSLMIYGFLRTILIEPAIHISMF